MFSNLGGFAATTQPAAAPAGLGVGSNLFGATANNPTTTLAVAPTSAVNTFAAAQPTNISKGFGSLSAGNTGFSGFGSLTSGAAATTFTGFAAGKFK